MNGIVNKSHVKYPCSIIGIKKCNIRFIRTMLVLSKND